jgi:hypothetical protein
LQLPDTKGFGNHGTLTNMDPGSDSRVHWVASGGKGALDFDGTNDQVDLAFAASIGTVHTTTAWIFPRGQATAFNFGGLCGQSSAKGNNQTASLYVSGPNSTTINSFGYSHVDALVTASGLTLENRWSFISSVRVGTRVDLYLNGLLQTTGNLAQNGKFSPTVLGRRLDFAANYNGLLDDFLFFEAALTASEVRFIYEQGRGGGMLYQPPRRRSYAAIIAALVLACETGNYSLTGQAAGLFASRLLTADQAQFLLSGNAATTTASRLLSADRASYTATGNNAATLCARLLDGGAAAYALTGTDAGLIANRKLTADQAVCFLAGNNAELLRALKLSADSRSLQLDGFAASLLAGRKLSADGAQYILVVSDANLTSSTGGAAPYYYLFMMRGPQ